MRSGVVSMQISIIWLLITSSSWEQELPAALCSFDALSVSESFDASLSVVYNTSSKHDCYRHCYEDDDCSYLEYKDGECIIYHETTSANKNSLKASALDSVYKLTRDNRVPKPCQIVTSKLTRLLPETIETGLVERLNTTSQTVSKEQCYMRFTSKGKATEAEIICNQNHGHLASIHFEKQNEMITAWSKSVESQKMLIGLKFKDISKREKYWLDGSEIDYEKWRKGEPSNSSEKNCTVVTPNGEWNNVFCDGEYSFACGVPIDACAKT